MRRAAAVPYVFPLLLAALGLGGLGWMAGQVVATSRIASRAEQVPATILNVGLEEEWSWRPLGRKEYRETARAHYYYFLDGVEYEGGQISALRLPLRSNAHHRSLIEGLEVGQSVPVFVHPDDPGQSYLSVAIDWWLVGAVFLFTATLAATGLTTTVLAWRRLHRGGGPLRRGRWLLSVGGGIGLSVVMLGSRLVFLGDPPGLLVVGLLILAAAISASFTGKRKSPAVQN